MTQFVIGMAAYWWWIEKRHVHSGSIDWDFSGFQPHFTDGTKFATREEAESHAVQIAAKYPRYVGKIEVQEAE